MDPNMLIVKKITNTDVSCKNGLSLSKPKMDYILRKMGISVPENGLQVEIQDNDKSYWVTLKQNSNGYHVGTGWSNIKNAKDLEKDDVVQLYWKDTKFIFSME
ncbi:hypothetical protein EUTSA_v10012253mg [Eutrema salsugineum]|uniref:TF-B3 domain-containing protein n=1 Tax=Eutrema salsugineum TaxID=72664 RepID=V4KTT3_EUTSA|nr:hypothetical protein EUTSA_v10012253mg [Eutrema salsugineum]